MARRRRAVGNVLEGASNTVGMFIQNMLKEDSERKMMAEKDQYARGLFEHNEGLRKATDLELDWNRNPQNAERRSRNGAPAIPGLDPASFKRSDSEIGKGIQDSIESADNINKLPTDPHMAFHGAAGDEHVEGDETGRPTIASLMKIREDRDKALRADMVKEVSGAYNPDGSTGTKFLSGDPRNLVGQSVQTTPTTEQSIATANATETGTRQGKIDTAIQTEKQTRGGAVARAGAEAGARASATNAAETAQLNDPRYQSGRAAVVGAEETARAKAAQVIIQNDPTIAAIASSVAANPDLLKDVPMAQRGKVIAALNAEEFRTARQKSTEKIITTGWDALQRLKNQGGQAAAVGPSFQKLPGVAWAGSSYDKDGEFQGISGTAAADYVGQMKQLKSILTLNNLEYLRGLGHMSNTEFGTAGAAATSLQTRQSEQKHQADLAVLERIFLESARRAGIQLPGATGSGTSPSEKLKALRGGG